MPDSAIPQEGCNGGAARSPCQDGVYYNTHLAGGRNHASKGHNRECASYGKSIRKETMEGEFEILLKKLRPDGGTLPGSLRHVRGTVEP
jgi:hypothetical protein